MTTRAFVWLHVRCWCFCYVVLVAIIALCIALINVIGIQPEISIARSLAYASMLHTAHVIGQVQYTELASSNKE